MSAYPAQVWLRCSNPGFCVGHCAAEGCGRWSDAQDPRLERFLRRLRCSGVWLPVRTRQRGFRPGKRLRPRVIRPTLPTFPGFRPIRTWRMRAPSLLSAPSKRMSLRSPRSFPPASRRRNPCPRRSALQRHSGMQKSMRWREAWRRPPMKNRLRPRKMPALSITTSTAASRASPVHGSGAAAHPASKSGSIRAATCSTRRSRSM